MQFQNNTKRLLFISIGLITLLGMVFVVQQTLKKTNEPQILYTVLSNESDLKETEPIRSVVVLSLNNYLGENQFANRVLLVGTQFNWKISVLFMDQFTAEALREKIEELNPNFVLSLFSNIAPIPNQINYVMLSKGNHFYMNESDTINLQECPHWEEIDGFLVTFSSYGTLDSFLEKNRSKPYFIQPFFHTCQSTDFVKNEYKYLFYSGFNWDKLRKSKVYKETFKKLDQMGYLKVYGPASRWKHLKHSYKGILRSNEEFLKAMHEAGITLVLHSNDHLDGASLATRIFEATATSTVAISDKHPLVQEYFGDSVLYIDQNTQSSEDFFKQIDGHVQFIHNNPEIAENLAQRSHQIFEDKFTLESQFQKLEDLHEKHLEQLATYSTRTLE